jgi:ABC-type lipoprotein release transport system permease subunit
MNVVAEWFRRLVYLFNRSRHDATLRAELLMAISFVACLLPAIRVAAVNPATALRHD